MSKLNIKIDVPGKGTAPPRAPSGPQPKNRASLERWILARNYDEHVKNELLKELRSIPDYTVPIFYQTIDARVNEIRKNQKS